MRSMLLSAVIGLSALGLLLAGPSAARADEKPATIRVTLPADATLTIDGQPTKSTAADRLFQTPALETGKEFQYTLRATVVRGDDTVSVERRVTVRAGQESRVSLTLPSVGADSRAFYYTPPSAPYSYPAGPVRGYVGSARHNWEPDFSDPFFMGGRN